MSTGKKLLFWGAVTAVVTGTIYLIARKPKTKPSIASPEVVAGTSTGQGSGQTTNQGGSAVVKPTTSVVLKPLMMYTKDANTPIYRWDFFLSKPDFKLPVLKPKGYIVGEIDSTAILPPGGWYKSKSGWVVNKVNIELK